jgi:stage IV sporulation protein FB
MITFRLFGYPVRIELFFWVLCVFLGMPFLQQQGPEGLGMFAITTAVILGSILWHEIGHAWARKRFGAAYSEITLHGMGGLCSGPGHFTRHESIYIAAAGPAASLTLGGLTWLLTLTPAFGDPWLRFFVVQMLRVNIVWALMNLLPILPLDGGHILHGFLAVKRADLVPKIGFILAIVVAVLGFTSGNLWMAILFGMLAHSNWRMMQHQGSSGRRF